MTIDIEKRAIPALLILALVLTWGCSSPKVSHTSISGEIKDIQHWRLEWVGAEQSPSVDIPGLFETSKYTADEYCAKYVEQVKRKLTREYGHSFAENYPDIGLIQVELSGEKLSAYVPPFDTANLYQDVAPGDRRWGTRDEADLVGATTSLFTDRDQVRKVRLRIFDLEGNPSGDVFIGESHEDKIKPEFVARVIDEIIRTGRYRGTKVMPISGEIKGK
ncbi:MAG: hypothetical protein GY867_01180 [bacterium]|nr:hypothetical protein [bacterium]